MTGMPNSIHNIKKSSEEKLWDTLLDYDQSNYIICAGTSCDVYTQRSNILTIVSLYEKEDLKLIKMRKPFKDFIWKGKFSENSKTWTKELKEDLGFIKEDKTCIFMDLADFINYFDYISVCHYNDKWIRNSIDVTSGSKKALFFELIIDEDTEVLISVHQRLPRFVVDSPDYDLSPVEIFVAEKIEGAQLRVIGIDLFLPYLILIATGEKDTLIGKETTYANSNMKLKLSQGRYVIRVKVRWVDQKEHEFTVNTLSTEQVVLRKIQWEESQTFLDKIFINEGFYAREKYQLGNCCEFISAWCSPYLWIYAINQGKKTWNLEINFKKLINLKLSKKYLKDHNSLKLEILPGKQRVAYIKRIDSDAVEVLWKMNHQWH